MKQAAGSGRLYFAHCNSGNFERRGYATEVKCVAFWRLAMNSYVNIIKPPGLLQNNPRGFICSVLRLCGIQLSFAHDPEAKQKADAAVLPSDIFRDHTGQCRQDLLLSGKQVFLEGMVLAIGIWKGFCCPWCTVAAGIDDGTVFQNTRKDENGKIDPLFLGEAVKCSQDLP